MTKVEVPQWAMWGAAGVVLLLLIPLLTMLAWNGFVPHVFGLPSLDYAEAFCFDLLVAPIVALEVLKVRVD